MGLSGVHLLLTAFGAAEQALGADSPVSNFYSKLCGRAAQAQRSALTWRSHENFLGSLPRPYVCHHLLRPRQQAAQARVKSQSIDYPKTNCRLTASKALETKAHITRCFKTY